MRRAAGAVEIVLVMFCVELSTGTVGLTAALSQYPDDVDYDYANGEQLFQVGLPPFLEVCYRDDPQLNKCIKNVIQRIVPKLRSGVEELDLPPLDPLAIEMLQFKYRSKSAMIGGDTVVRDVYISKLSTVKIVEARARVQDPTKFYLEFEAHYDRVESWGKYELVGNIARIPINTNGLFNITMYDVNFMYVVKGDLVTGDDGLDYMKLNKFQYLNSNRGIGSIKIYATNLVERNPFLNMFAIRFLNQFWKPISREILPIIEPMIDKFTTDFFNNIFLRIPYDMLLPKSRDAFKKSFSTF